MWPAVRNVMQYNTLGSSDIKVSKIALGTMTWGEQNSQAEAFEQMDYSLEQGVNFFDTAELYPVPPRPETQGATETIIGNWLASRGKREQIVLASKITGRGDANSGTGHIRGGPRLSREQIHQAIDTSLERLQTDYLDLYQLHWPERRTNFFGQLGYSHGSDDGIEIEETLSALAELVGQGKVRNIGISNESAWGLMEYKRIAREKNLPIIQSIQNPYSLLNRTFEVGLAECAIRERVGLLAYSPLAFGVLSGKYLNGQMPEGARLSLYSRFQRYNSEQAAGATEAYVNLAKEHDLDPAQMALAFVNSRSFLTSNIIGATTMDQLKSNISSIDVELSKDVLAGIRDIHNRWSNPAP